MRTQSNQQNHHGPRQCEEEDGDYDAPIILMIAAENESEGLIPLPSLLTEEYLAWGIRRNDVELLESANTFIATLRNDGRLNSIVNRWIPFTN